MAERRGAGAGAEGGGGAGGAQLFKLFGSVDVDISAAVASLNQLQGAAQQTASAQQRYVAAINQAWQRAGAGGNVQSQNILGVARAALQAGQNFEGMLNAVGALSDPATVAQFKALQQAIDGVTASQAKATGAAGPGTPQTVQSIIQGIREQAKAATQQITLPGGMALDRGMFSQAQLQQIARATAQASDQAERAERQFNDMVEAERRAITAARELQEIEARSTPEGLERRVNSIQREVQERQRLLTVPTMPGGELYRYTGGTDPAQMARSLGQLLQATAQLRYGNSDAQRSFDALLNVERQIIQSEDELIQRHANLANLGRIAQAQTAGLGIGPREINTGPVQGPVVEAGPVTVNAPATRRERTAEQQIGRGPRTGNLSASESAQLSRYMDIMDAGQQLGPRQQTAFNRLFARATSVPQFERGLAGGGAAYAGHRYLVGEQGPEVFIPQQTGYVQPQFARDIFHELPQITRIAGPNFRGVPVPQQRIITPQATGDVGEDIAVAWLRMVENLPAAHANINRKNAPWDIKAIEPGVLANLVESKAGNIANLMQSQQWRLKYGGSATARSLGLTPEEFALWASGQTAAAFARKSGFIAGLGGLPVKTRTMTSIIDPDRQLADIYTFPGLHERIGWRQPHVGPAYQGTVHFEYAPDINWLNPRKQRGQFQAEDILRPEDFITRENFFPTSGRRGESTEARLRARAADAYKRKTIGNAQANITGDWQSSTGEAADEFDRVIERLGRRRRATGLHNEPTAKYLRELESERDRRVDEAYKNQAPYDETTMRVAEIRSEYPELEVFRELRRRFPGPAVAPGELEETARPGRITLTDVLPTLQAHRRLFRDAPDLKDAVITWVGTPSINRRLREVGGDVSQLSSDRQNFVSHLDTLFDEAVGLPGPRRVYRAFGKFPSGWHVKQSRDLTPGMILPDYGYQGAGITRRGASGFGYGQDVSVMVDLPAGQKVIPIHDLGHSLPGEEEILLPRSHGIQVTSVRNQGRGYGRKAEGTFILGKYVPLPQAMLPSGMTRRSSGLYVPEPEPVPGLSPAMKTAIDELQQHFSSAAPSTPTIKAMEDAWAKHQPGALEYAKLKYPQWGWTPSTPIVVSTAATTGKMGFGTYGPGSFHDYKPTESGVKLFDFDHDGPVEVWDDFSSAGERQIAFVDPQHSTPQILHKIFPSKELLQSPHKVSELKTIYMDWAADHYDHPGVISHAAGGTLSSFEMAQKKQNANILGQQAAPAEPKKLLAYGWAVGDMVHAKLASQGGDVYNAIVTGGHNDIIDIKYLTPSGNTKETSIEAYKLLTGHHPNAVNGSHAAAGSAKAAVPTVPQSVYGYSSGDTVTMGPDAGVAKGKTGTVIDHNPDVSAYIKVKVPGEPITNFVLPEEIVSHIPVGVTPQPIPGVTQPAASAYHSGQWVQIEKPGSPYHGKAGQIAPHPPKKTGLGLQHWVSVEGVGVPFYESELLLSSGPTIGPYAWQVGHQTKINAPMSGYHGQYGTISKISQINKNLSSYHVRFKDGAEVPFGIEELDEPEFQRENYPGLHVGAEMTDIGRESVGIVHSITPKGPLIQTAWAGKSLYDWEYLDRRLKGLGPGGMAQGGIEFHPAMPEPLPLTPRPRGAGGTEEYTLEELEELFESSGYYPGLSTQQRFALAHYGASGYIDINRFMRGTPSKLTFGGTNPKLRQEYIKNIQEALARGPVLERPLTVLRRVGTNVYGRPIGKKLIGTEFTDPAFVSTSVKEPSSSFGMHRQIITLPPGSRVGAPFVHPGGGLTFEDELLLQSGSRFRITGAQRTNIANRGGSNVHMELLPQFEPDIPSGEELQRLPVTGGQGGSQEGGWRGEYYIKPQTSQERAENELGAMLAYRFAGAQPGVDVPETAIREVGGEPAIVSKRLTGVSSMGHKPSQELIAAAKKHWGMDVLLAHYDVVGMALDNMLKGQQGPVRIETGGTMAFRAMGGPKRGWTAAEAPEQMYQDVLSLRGTHPQHPNPQLASVFGGISDEEAAGLLENLHKTFDVEHLAKTWEAAGIHTSKSRETLDVIKARLAAIPGVAKRLRGQFQKDRETAGYLQEHFGRWAERLSPFQRYALSTWGSGEGWQAINPALRGEETENQNPALNAMVQSTLAGLIRNAPPLTRDIRGYRGLSQFPDFARARQGGGLYRDFRTGDVLSHPGFSSTSIYRDVAEDFASLSIGRPGALLGFTIPRGTRLIPPGMGEFGGHSLLGTQGELLLPRHSRFALGAREEARRYDFFESQLLRHRRNEFQSDNDTAELDDFIQKCELRLAQLGPGRADAESNWIRNQLSAALAARRRIGAMRPGAAARYRRLFSPYGAVATSPQRYNRALYHSEEEPAVNFFAGLGQFQRGAGIFIPPQSGEIIANARLHSALRSIDPMLQPFAAKMRPWDAQQYAGRSAVAGGPVRAETTPATGVIHYRPDIVFGDQHRLAGTVAHEAAHGFWNAMPLAAKAGYVKAHGQNAMEHFAEEATRTLHLPRRFQGGYVNAGMPYLVGEYGAELYVPNGKHQFQPTPAYAGAIATYEATLRGLPAGVLPNAPIGGRVANIPVPAPTSEAEVRDLEEIYRLRGQINAALQATTQHYETIERAAEQERATEERIASAERQLVNFAQMRTRQQAQLAQGARAANIVQIGGEEVTLAPQGTPQRAQQLQHAQALRQQTERNVKEQQRNQQAVDQAGMNFFQRHFGGAGGENSIGNLLSGFGTGRNANIIRFGAGLFGLPLGINIFAGIARDIHAAISTAIADQEQWQRAVRATAAIYGSTLTPAIEAASERLAVTPGLRGTRTQFEEAQNYVGGVLTQRAANFTPAQRTAVVEMGGAMANTFTQLGDAATATQQLTELIMNGGDEWAKYKVPLDDATVSLKLYNDATGETLRAQPLDEQRKARAIVAQQEVNAATREGQRANDDLAKSADNLRIAQEAAATQNAKFWAGLGIAANNAATTAVKALSDIETAITHLGSLQVPTINVGPVQFGGQTPGGIAQAILTGGITGPARGQLAAIQGAAAGQTWQQILASMAIGMLPGPLPGIVQPAVAATGVLNPPAPPEQPAAKTPEEQAKEDAAQARDIWGNVVGATQQAYAGARGFWQALVASNNETKAAVGNMLELAQVAQQVAGIIEQAGAVFGPTDAQIQAIAQMRGAYDTLNQLAGDFLATQVSTQDVLKANLEQVRDLPAQLAARGQQATPTQEAFAEAARRTLEQPELLNQFTPIEQTLQRLQTIVAQYERQLQSAIQAQNQLIEGRPGGALGFTPQEVQVLGANRGAIDALSQAMANQATAAGDAQAGVTQYLDKLIEEGSKAGASAKQVRDMQAALAVRSDPQRLQQYQSVETALVSIEQRRAQNQIEASEAQARVSSLNRDIEIQRLNVANEIAGHRMNILNLEDQEAPLLLRAQQIQNAITRASRENLDVQRQLINAQIAGLGPARRLEDLQRRQQRDALEANVVALRLQSGQGTQADLERMMQLQQDSLDAAMQIPQAALDDFDQKTKTIDAQRAADDDQLTRQKTILDVYEDERRSIEDATNSINERKTAEQQAIDAINRQVERYSLLLTPAMTAANLEVTRTDAIGQALQLEEQFWRVRLAGIKATQGQYQPRVDIGGTAGTQTVPGGTRTPEGTTVYPGSVQPPTAAQVAQASQAADVAGQAVIARGGSVDEAQAAAQAAYNQALQAATTVVPPPPVNVTPPTPDEQQINAGVYAPPPEAVDIAAQAADVAGQGTVAAGGTLERAAANAQIVYRAAVEKARQAAAAAGGVLGGARQTGVALRTVLTGGRDQAQAAEKVQWTFGENTYRVGADRIVEVQQGDQWVPAPPETFDRPGFAAAYVSAITQEPVQAAQHGAIINPVPGGRLVLAGEAGEREYIMPERQIRQFLQQRAMGVPIPMAIGPVPAVSPQQSIAGLNVANHLNNPTINSMEDVELVARQMSEMASSRTHAEIKTMLLQVLDSASGVPLPGLGLAGGNY